MRIDWSSYTDDNKSVHYAYDGNENRTGMSASGAVYGNYEYIYDINAGLPRLLVEKDSSGEENNYIYAGRILSGIGPAGQMFYHQDGLGSISVISDVYGNPLNLYTYDAFGEGKKPSLESRMWQSPAPGTKLSRNSTVIVEFVPSRG